VGLLAHLEPRCAAIKNDMAGSCLVYQDVSMLWKEADHDLPIDAKKEDENLKTEL
jgi:hypothetical protein